MAARLQSADDPVFIQGLLSVFSHLLLSHGEQVIELLATVQVQVPPDNAPGGTPPQSLPALEALMRKWTERQTEIRTAYDIKLTTSALAWLLACRHPALEGVTVRGRRADTDGSVRTRARAKTFAEQWSQVPLKHRLLALLADAYIEADVQGDGDGDDSGEGGEGGSEADSDDDWSEDGSDPLGIFSGLIDFDDDDGGLGPDPLEAERRKGDPIGAIDVGSMVGEALRAAAAAQPEAMRAGCAALTPTQLLAVQRAFQGQR
jgi:importin-9